MFGVPQEQFHQLIASSRTLSSLPINPLPFSTSSPHPFPINFDAYPSSSPPSQSHHLLHHLHQPPLLLPNKDDDDDDDNDNDAHNKVQETHIHFQGVELFMDPWSNDEVLSLLRIRSSMDNWFPDFTWEHVSRKMAEFGFKRSADKCKEKFEAETRDFNRLCFNKPRFDSELEELYHGDKTRKKNEEEDNDDEQGELLARNVAINNLPEQRTVVELKKSTASSSSSKQNLEIKKRKREKKFEKFKEFCVEVVNKMMVQQEEMHNKLLEDFLSRDDENIAREEAWRKQEMENFIKEAEIRTREQAIAGDKQATIIEIMNNFTSQEAFEKIAVSYEELLKVSNTLSSLTSSYQNILPQNNSSSTETLSHSNPSNSTSNLQQNHTYKTASLSAPSFPQVKPQKPTNERDDIGKRWPKDEVLALINMRCKLYTNNSNNNEEAGAASGSKGSLWERISQGMMELGYKRSAKRCKEKWENINKYFRKTKDVNKKRSVDSRTCPYFQQLSSLYDQGTLVAPDTDGLTSENRSQTSC